MAVRALRRFGSDRADPLSYQPERAPRREEAPPVAVVGAGPAGLSCAHSLSLMGYRVTVNDPYKGMELVARYSSPARRRCSLQIEINRALYMDERRIEKHCGFAPLKKSLTRLVATVCEFARERTECRERRRG